MPNPIPDPDGRNAVRAASAASALSAFECTTMADSGDSLADLLCDLAHYCDREGIGFAAALQRAAMHYQGETGNQGAQLVCERQAVCADCAGVFAAVSLLTVRDRDQRVSPGEEEPAGECPDCGALCHYLK